MTAPPALVIGAGPAGLAAAASLQTLGLACTVLERGGEVGCSWRAHYDRLHLHTIRELSHLPGRPLPSDAPRYVPRAQVVAYLEDYARAFAIAPSFGVEIGTVTRDGDRWRVDARDGRRFVARHVVLATGVNRTPVIPDWPGLADTALAVVHSRDYRNGADLRGRSALVVGMGNTGAEIALDLCEHGARAAISLRGAVNVVLRDTLGQPVQRTAMLLARLPAAVADPVGRLLQRLTVGDLSRLGIARPAMSPAAQLRTTGRTPTIDVGTIARIRRGEIAVLPAIERFERDAVRFVDGVVRRFDRVIACTGYRADLAALAPAVAACVDANGYPRGFAGTGAASGLYWLGFDPYAPGGVLASIRRDAPRVAAAIAAGSRAA